MEQCPLDMFPYTIEPGDTLQKIAQRFDSSINLISAANPGLIATRLNVGEVICIPSSFTPPDYNTVSCPDNGYTIREVELINVVRRLWEEHIAWTRMAIISIVEDLPDAEFVVERLLRNPSDFAVVLGTVYGDQVASTFVELFTDHVMIASELVKAAKGGNTDAAAKAEQRWYENADEIAKFFASINPYWSEQSWVEMLHEHLDLIKAEALERINGNYEEDIAIYDEIEDQAMKMADMMSEGIMRQFPSKF